MTDVEKRRDERMARRLSAALSVLEVMEKGDADELIEKLFETLTFGQFKTLVDLMREAKQMATERRCDQRVEIVFNDKGFPRHFNGTNNFRVEVKP